jgi:DNA-binding NtrC family response regulator
MHLAPLRQRVGDIAPLATAFAAKFAAKFGTGPAELSPEALHILEAYPWPGNIRQLENVVMHAVLTSDGPHLLPAHLPATVLSYTTAEPRADGTPAASLRQRNADAEREFLLRALHRSGFCRTRTARTLGISRMALYQKIKRHGLGDMSP